MGTALTGLEIKDTYDSLLKITDNGPLSATAKYLSDGLGNDSALALSTARVGVGTSSPATTLDVAGTLRVSSATPTEEFFNTSSGDVWASIFGQASGTGSGASLVFSTKRDGNTATDKMTITQAGNVGIGVTPSAWGTNDKAIELGGSNSSTYTGLNVTSLAKNCYYDGTNWVYEQSAVTSLLYQQSFLGNHIFYTAPTGTAGAAITFTEAVSIDSNGIKFNGDTAAANALDDYEEGTWTMGISFGGASVGVTTSSNTGAYTKIGRQVTVNGVIVLTSKGSSTGSALITGLPFTIANNFGANYAAAVLRLENVTFANQFQAYGGIGSTVVAIDKITEAGVNGSLTAADFANNSTVMISLTYFV